jgi:hypothetical protein
MYGSKPVSVTATVTLTLVACTVLLAHNIRGRGNSPPTYFLGIT